MTKKQGERRRHIRGLTPEELWQLLRHFNRGLGTRWARQRTAPNYALGQF